MSVPNHALQYRPLRAGIAISNPKAHPERASVGTLGLIVADGSDHWLLSCYHVLCREDFSPFGDGEPIYQPLSDVGDKLPVAHVAAGRADPSLDCAAAKVAAGVRVALEVLGLPPLASPRDPAVDTRVLKAGYYTGVTEGIVTAVAGGQVEIGLAPGFALSYNLSDPGDSGAVWVERDSGAPVVLQTQGCTSGRELAYGVPILTALRRLGLPPAV